MNRPLPQLLLALLLVNLCLLESGCELKLPPMPWDKKPHVETAQAAGDEGGGDEGGGADIEPVDLTKLLPEAMRKLPFEEVTIPMRDQLMLYGKLYDPGQKPQTDEADTTAAPSDGGDEAEYKGPQYPLVILIHGLGRTNTAWNDLPATLVKAGYAVYAVDLRGHGKSTKTTHGRRVSWRLFKPEHWQLMAKDLDQVIQYFQKKEDYPQIDGKHVAVIGEKLGANVSVFTARDNANAVQALVLLSPSLDEKGIVPSQAIVDYAHPALLIASEDNADGYRDTLRLYNWLPGHKAMQVYHKIGDGAEMLSEKSAVGDQIRDWLLQNLPPVAAKPAAGEKAPSKKPGAQPASATTANPANKG